MRINYLINTPLMFIEIFLKVKLIKILMHYTHSDWLKSGTHTYSAECYRGCGATEPLMHC